MMQLSKTFKGESCPTSRVWMSGRLRPIVITRQERMMASYLGDRAQSAVLRLASKFPLSLSIKYRLKLFIIINDPRITRKLCASRTIYPLPNQKFSDLVMRQKSCFIANRIPASPEVIQECKGYNAA